MVELEFSLMRKSQIDFEYDEKEVLIVYQIFLKQETILEMMNKTLSKKPEVDSRFFLILRRIRRLLFQESVLLH